MIKFITVLSTFILAQDLTFSGLNAPAYNDKGEMTSLLKSQTAINRNSQFELQLAVLEIFGKSRRTITTPKCFYNPVDKKVFGRENIKIEDDQLEITGQGFECDLNTKIVKIHRNVIIYFSRNMKEEL